jgi:predicted Zn finger-like uncharacterized protein
MNVTCPSCRTVYRVDPAKVPAMGVVARCARCPAEFSVGAERAAAIPVEPQAGFITGIDAEEFAAQPVAQAAATASVFAPATHEVTEGDSPGLPTGEWAREPVPDVTDGLSHAPGPELSTEAPTAPPDVVEAALPSSTPAATDAIDIPPPEAFAESAGVASVAPTSTEASAPAPVSDAHTDRYSATPDSARRDETAPEAAGDANAWNDSPTMAPATQEADSWGTHQPLADAGSPAATAPAHGEMESARTAAEAEAAAAAESEVATAAETTIHSRELDEFAREPVAAPAPAREPDALYEPPSTSAPTDDLFALPPAPFGSTDPQAKARRLARALVSDIVVYHPDRRERSLRQGTLRQEFRDEIRKSWDEYVGQVGEQMARDTTFFRDALNELLAGGNRIF